MSDELKRAWEAFETARTNQDHGAVVAALDEVIAIQPSVSAFLSRADAYEGLGNPTRALDDYNQAALLAPNDATAFYNRGLLYYSLEMIEQSIEDFSKSIELDSSDPWTYYNRGLAYLGREQYEESIADFTAAVELNPTFIDALGNIGNAYSALGEHQKAIEEFKRVLSINPTDSLALHNIANEYFRLGQHREAIENYTLALKQLPDDPSSIKNRARAYVECGEFEKAIADYGELLRLGSPFMSGLHKTRGELYEKIGQRNLARDEFQMAKKTAPLENRLLKQVTMDQQLLQELVSMRCPLNVAREIDHAFVCPGKKANDLVERLKSLGLTVEPPEKNLFGKVWIECHENASPSDMAARTLELIRIAFEFDASYDGWGTGGV